MKKSVLRSLVAVPALLLAVSAQADHSDTLNLSGAVDVGMGYQFNNDSVVGNVGLYNGTADQKEYRFTLNQVELNGEGSFAEMVGYRFDIDFFGGNNNNGLGSNLRTDDKDEDITGNPVVVEQAYVTTGIPVGNGVEFMVGKFNAPIGVESVDAYANYTIGFSLVFSNLQPFSVTGAKLYYEVNDMFNFHIAAVNDIGANGFVADSNVPSFLGRWGFNFGEHSAGLGWGVGAETTDANKDSSNLDYFADLDVTMAATDALTLVFNGNFRLNTREGDNTNAQAFGIMALANYQVSDVWDVTLRGSWLNESKDVSATGYGKGNYYEGTLATGYTIADGARFKAEYRLDYQNPDGVDDAGLAHTVAGQFAYTF